MATAAASAPTKKHRRALSLSFYIAALFTALIVLAGGVIGWFNHLQTSRIILAASDRVLDEIYGDIVGDLQLGSRRNNTTLAMLAFSSVNLADTLDQRLTSLPLFREALGGNERITSLYVGYDDGEFFQVIPLRTTGQKAFYQVPDQASYVVWSIEREPRTPVDSRYLFFDRELVRVGERAVEGPPYDPRERPWYQAVLGSEDIRVTAPYAFFTTGEIGVTAARRNGAATGVVAGDMTLASLSALLAERVISPSASLAIYAASGDVIASPEWTRAGHQPDPTPVRLPTLSTLGAPVLSEIARQALGRDLTTDLEWQGRRWRGAQRSLTENDGGTLFLVMAAPLDELLAEANRIHRRSTLLTGGLILAVLPLAWLISLLASRPLRTLEAEARGVQEFDFRQSPTRPTPVREINRLAGTIADMKRTIRNFLGISADLSAERRFPRLLEHVARQSMSAAEAAAAVLYLRHDDAATLDPAGLALQAAATVPGKTLLSLPLSADGGDAGLARLAQLEATQSFAVAIDEITRDPDTAAALLATMGSAPPIATAVPLKTPHGETVGVLCLLGTGKPDAPPPKPSRRRLAFVEALAGVAAVAIDNQRLYKAQKELMDALIKLVAGAIDEKSPYTGGHCQRVPVITRLLAEAACASTRPPFDQFSLDEDDWEALDIACWLHDCGKVTTPEYVVDKATKLQTLYDRIHEIRMRFEVLKRDGEIAFWQAVAEGGDRAMLRAQLEDAWRALDEEYAFVARCNEGAEFMAPERIERLRRIGQRRWLRTLDDRIGISWEEKERKGEGTPLHLPVDEPLLADKPEHLVRRRSGEKRPENQHFGFNLDTPEYRYNLGELHNLSVARGTLTAEERFVINNHIVQTIVMLGKLPFPKHLRCVPEFAGGHHEKVNGSGYPRRLTGDEMSLPSRMMAIADIFEALTASDRPYKKAKTLGEAIEIMDVMRKDGEIDADLFELFLKSGAYLDYARHFLDPEQIDDVDVAKYWA